MTKTIVLALALTASTLACQAQVRYNHKQMQTERIGRGVVAFRSGQKVVVSWRTLPGDKRHEAFNVYRNGVRLNAKPLKKGGTFFVDDAPLQQGATYSVRGGGHDGAFTLPANAPDGYLAIPLTPPTTTDSMEIGRAHV